MGCAGGGEGPLKAACGVNTCKNTPRGRYLEKHISVKAKGVGMHHGVTNSAQVEKPGL